MTTLLRDYLDRGWRLVLLKSKSKAPCRNEWTSVKLTDAEAFAHVEGGGNLGVQVGEPSGHLVDLDLDVAEARKLAATFLPPTGRTHGRASSLASHWWYTSASAPTVRFKDTNGACLLELRGAAGTQTAIPPSVHPSGEAFVWLTEGDPAPVDADALRVAASRLAACVLLARHWPQNGARHECALALSTVLLNAGLSVDEAARIITNAAKLAGDEEWQLRRRDVESTEKRLTEGQPVTGIPKLVDLLGEKVVTLLRQWLGLNGDDAVSPTTVLRPLQALTNNPPPEVVEAALRRVGVSLNGADPLRRLSIRQAVIEILEKRNVAAPAKLVDAALRMTSDDEDAAGQGRPLQFPPIEPWPDTVDGAALLDEVASTFRRFVALPEHADTALALWAVHTHAESAAFVSPILCLSSPEPRCGKTTTLNVMQQLVPKPLAASNVTGATIFRTVEAFCPTLLIDEADTFIRDNDELRGVLNSGHTRPSAQVIRLVGDDHEPRAFSTWCPKLIALIKRLPATLEDRAIVIPHRRRAPGERVEKMRADRLQGLTPVGRKIARWVRDHLEALKAADPDVPDALHDRAADNWRPLFAIADAAGGEWPSRARRAAVTLTAGDGDDATPSLGGRLLADIRAVWPTHEPYLATVDLLTRLLTLEGGHWLSFNRGGGLTGKRLATLLGGYRIKPKQSTDSSRSRGYERTEFTDAWARYLDPERIERIERRESAGLP
jgi:putative DNA primase/helicase